MRGVAGPAANNPEVVGYRGDFMAELMVARLILAIQPALDDSITSAPWRPKWGREIFGIVREQRTDVVRIVAVPGGDIPLNPRIEVACFHGGQDRGPPIRSATAPTGGLSPIETATPSASGKTLVVASTRGNQKTGVQIDERDLYVGVNAYVYAEPKGGR